jgi:thiol-disulfide isomerase/thioredoxin
MEFMKKIFIFFLFLITLNANAIEKETTFNQKLFNKAQSEGKIVIISSWIKYCSSCAGQMKILKKAKNDGKLKDINFDNIEYFSFDVTNKNIADLFNVQYQTTLLIFKNNEEVYRSLGETSKNLIYEAIKSSI